MTQFRTMGKEETFPGGDCEKNLLAIWREILAESLCLSLSLSLSIPPPLSFYLFPISECTQRSMWHQLTTILYQGEANRAETGRTWILNDVVRQLNQTNPETSSELPVRGLCISFMV